MAGIPSQFVRQVFALLLLGAALPCAYGTPNISQPAFAWGENIGWINFAPTSGPGVTVCGQRVSGYAWGENVGWISLSPIGGGVINSAGVLSGYAWGENVGWVNFMPPVGGVAIDASGKFTGYAWGENIGWINFATQNPVITDSIFCNGFEPPPGP